MKNETYVFFYYWSSDLRPCASKGVKGIGDHNAIKGACWEIDEHTYDSLSITTLTAMYPWPFLEEKDENGS